MTKIAEYPYNDYKIYKVFHNKEKRNYAILVPLDNSNKKRTTISYARYLMSVKEGRILNSWELNCWTKYGIIRNFFTF